MNDRLPLPPMAGVTLIELLATITIAAILMSIAVPSYRYVTNTNRIATEVNGLVGDLQYARAEAIKEGRPVTICVSSNAKDCDGTTTWQSGWMVFSDPDSEGSAATGKVPLRAQKTFSSTDTFKSDGIKAVTFNREGFALLTGTATLKLKDATGNSEWTRCLTITNIGVLTTNRAGTGGCT